jgi:hypothetical protein
MNFLETATNFNECVSKVVHIFQTHYTLFFIYHFYCRSFTESTILFLQTTPIPYLWKLIFSHIDTVPRFEPYFAFLATPKLRVDGQINLKYLWVLGDRLRTHPNHLAVNLRLLTSGAFAGFCLLICLTDSNELFFVVILVFSYLLVSLVPY